MNDLYYMGLYGGDDYYHSLSSPGYLNERNQKDFYSENEGFIKGNIQKNIYQPYRGYNPSLPVVNNDKDRLLLEIQKYCFYLIDLGLYLDVHPNDAEAIKLYNENRSKYFRLVNEYNKNYCPLMAVDSNSTNTYKWVEGSFPWVRGNK